MSAKPEEQSTEEVILSELALVFEPIGDAVTQGTDEAIEQLLADIGLDETAVGSNYDALIAELERLQSPWNTVQTDLIDPLESGTVPDLADLDDVFAAIRKCFDIVTGLDDISIEAPDIERVGELTFDYLLITYLYDHHPGVHSMLSLVGVIQTDGQGAAGDLELSALGNVFANPGQYVDDLFSWGTEEFEPYVVLFYVKGLVRQFGMDASFDDITGVLANGLPDTEEIAEDIAHELLTYLLADVDVPADIEQLATEIASDVADDFTQGETPDPEELLGTVAEKTATKLQQELQQELQDEPLTLPDKQDLLDELPIGQPNSMLESRQLSVNLLSMADASGEAGIAVIPVPGKNSQLPGLAIKPYGSVSGTVSETLGNGWTFNAEFSAQANWALQVTADTSGTTAAEVIDLDTGSAVEGDAYGEANLAYESDDDQVTPILGDPAGTGIGVRYFQAGLTIEYDGETAVFTVEIPARGRIQIQPDGPFLETVMPDEVGYDFDATVGWASDTGLYFERGGTLEVSLPQGKSVGPLLMEEVYAAMKPADGADGAGSAGGSGAESGGSGAGGAGGDTASGANGAGGVGAGSGDGTGSGGAGAGGSMTPSGSVDVRQGTITLQGAVSGSAELGPFTATVRRIGVEAEMSFPEDGGNLGPADVDIAFKPPEGVGLSIDAGAVTGGGYLEFDPENDRYAGVLQLKAADLTINAVGLLTTDLPGKDDGFSLLLILSGEFQPVQLGMGFSLNGAGGLVGVNRTVKSDPLGRAVREGSMDSILFPENPIANSQRIISDLRTIFPSKADTHVFGPIVKIGWGTPTLITADIGVVLEIPTWKIVLLGRLSATLPDENAPLIELNLAVAGVLDPPNERVAIDATLYDSRVVAWSLSGDMALRSNWGSNPRFVLSVGGFNPRFDPPSEFPELDRVRASLGPPSGNPSIEFYGYFAVTSNTVQAGAGVHLLAKAGPAKVEGRLQFDTLIQFDPFGFVVDFLASLSVTIKGKGLSIRLDGTLKGPGPFEISGTIKIDILFITVTAQVDVTLGSGDDDESLPPAKIMPELTAALGEPSNWSAGRPGTANNMVALREVDAEADRVFAHPLAEIGVRQTVVPLEFRLEKYGNARPTGYTRFSIESAAVTGGGALELGASTAEQFAPAQYRKMSDQEKMDSPAFQSEVAGQKMRHEGVYIGDDDAENVRSARLGFESTVIDKTNDNHGTPLAELGGFRARDMDPISTVSPQVADSLADVSAVANSPIRKQGVERFRPSDADVQAHRAQLSGVASAVDSDTAASPDGDSTAADGSATDGESASDTSYVVRGGATPEMGGLSVAVSPDESQYVIASKTTLERVDIPSVDQPLSKSAAKRALSALAETNPRRAESLQVVEASQARENDSASESPTTDDTATQAGETATDDGGLAGEKTTYVTVGGAGQRYLGGNQ